MSVHECGSNINQSLDRFLSENTISETFTGKPIERQVERHVEIDPFQDEHLFQKQNSTGATLEEDEMFDEDGNFQIIEKPLIICALGKCGVGKSYLIKSLIYNYSKKRYFKFGLCIVSTKFNGGYNYLPDKYVIENYNEAYLKNYIDKLKTYKKTRGHIPPSFLILDDIVGNVNFYSAFWQNLITTYRHLNLTIILGTQALSSKGGISTIFRQMCNMCFMFRTVYHDTIEGMYKAFGGLCENMDEFQDMFLETTSLKFQCLLFVNDKNSKEDSYYSYIAPKVPEFKLNF